MYRKLSASSLKFKKGVSSSVSMPIGMYRELVKDFKIVYVLGVFFTGVLLIACGNQNKEEEIVKNVSGKSIDGLLVPPYPTETHDMGLLKLSEYGFFKQPLSKLEPVSDRVISYELNSPLFTDYASKKRFIALPKATQINYTSEGVLDFPRGTILFVTN